MPVPNISAYPPENPFVNNRVDSPFISVDDAKNIFAKEYQRLKKQISRIKNHKASELTVITGTPGSGKSHLLMRLTQEVLQHNRVLWITQPSSIYVTEHIYHRSLESFSRVVQTLDGMELTQFEYLLARSFYNILQPIYQQQEKASQTFTQLMEDLRQDPLRLYTHISKSKNYATFWGVIERQILQWWKGKTLKN